MDNSIDFLSEFNIERAEKYLENTFTDIEAIQRVLLANETISEDTEFKKTTFYYLSSTPKKSKAIFDIIKKHYTGNFKSFGDRSPNILRNIFQVFLSKTLIEEYPSGGEIPLKMLELVKKLKSYKAKQIDSLQESDSSTISNELTKLLEKYSYNIENHFYGRLFNNGHKLTLAEIIQKEDSTLDKSGKDLMHSFKKFVEEYKTETESVDFSYNVSKI